MNGKVLQIVEPGRPELIQAPVPAPARGEVLVKIQGVTTCPHWDIHVMSGVPMFPGREAAYPYTSGQPGHEAVGEVVAVGAGVHEPAEGARVAAWRDQGHQRPGCYAQYNVFTAENLLEVPKNLAVEEIAPLELGMCVRVAFSKLEHLDGVCGKRVAVSGLGPAGLIAIQMARIGGAQEIVGIDPVEARRDLGKELGADRVFSPGDGGLPTGRFGNASFHTAVDCTGLGVSVQYLMNSTGDNVYLFGVLRDAVAFGFSHWSRLNLIGAGKHNRQAAEEALEMIVGGSLQLSPLVSCSLPLESYRRGVDLLMGKKALKICFLPWESSSENT